MLNACSSGGDDGGDNDAIIDNINPSISCPADIMVNISSTESGAVVEYQTPVGTDNVSAITNQSAGLPSGSLFPVGVTTNTFTAKDAAGNSAACSFTVTVNREEPSASAPYFIDSNPAPSGKIWTKVDDLSDEFDGTSLDEGKWHNNPATDPFGWYGRPPALFESDNVSVSDGNLKVTVEKFESPKVVDNTTWTYGGAILRSKVTAKPGYYYEAKMQANKTVMSSTFWIAFPINCTSGPTRKLELDIQECVGRVHSETQNWALQWDNIYHSNAWSRSTSCDGAANESKPGVLVLNEKNHSRYFVYGCWWKSPNEILFYLDGEYTFTITPPEDYSSEGYITMAIETYDWNPIDIDNDLIANGTIEERTTKYDWIRTWELKDQ